MTPEDFAANCALEVASRVGRIIPVLDDFLDGGDEPLTDKQKVGLGSVLLLVFDGITDSFECMADVRETLEGFSLADEAARYLAEQDGLSS